MVESALEHAKILQDNDFHEFKISVKASDVFLTVAAYHQLAEAITARFMLALPRQVVCGLARSNRRLVLASVMGRYRGYGPGVVVGRSGRRVKTGYEMLNTGVATARRHSDFCPSCARQQFDVIKTVQTIEDRLEHIDLPITVSIIGCVVNGPGEARETDIGLTGGQGTHQIYLSGMAHHRLSNGDIVEHVVELVEARVAAIKAADAAPAQAEKGV